MASRLEINFIRLLSRCESIASEKRGETEWRLEKVRRCHPSDPRVGPLWPSAAHVGVSVPVVVVVVRCSGEPPSRWATSPRRPLSGCERRHRSDSRYTSDTLSSCCSWLVGEHLCGISVDTLVHGYVNGRVNITRSFDHHLISRFKSAVCHSSLTRTRSTVLQHGLSLWRL